MNLQYYGKPRSGYPSTSKTDEMSGNFKHICLKTAQQFIGVFKNVSGIF